MAAWLARTTLLAVWVVKCCKAAMLACWLSIICSGVLGLLDVVRLFIVGFMAPALQQAFWAACRSAKSNDLGDRPGIHL